MVQRMAKVCYTISIFALPFWEDNSVNGTFKQSIRPEMHQITDVDEDAGLSIQNQYCLSEGGIKPLEHVYRVDTPTTYLKTHFSVRKRKMETEYTYGGKESSSVPGGCTGTGDQDDLGVRISRPAWEARWKRRVREPGNSVKEFLPLNHLNHRRLP